MDTCTDLLRLHKMEMFQLKVHARSQVKRKQKRVNENWAFDLNKSMRMSFGAPKPESNVSSILSQDRKGSIVVKKLPIFYGY